MVNIERKERAGGGGYKKGKKKERKGGALGTFRSLPLKFNGDGLFWVPFTSTIERLNERG